MLPLLPLVEPAELLEPVEAVEALEVPVELAELVELLEPIELLEPVELLELLEPVELVLEGPVVPLDALELDELAVADADDESDALVVPLELIGFA